MKVCILILVLLLSLESSGFKTNFLGLENQKFLQVQVEEKNEKDFIGNWMKYSLGFLSQQTMLDISIPGSHDSLTYDSSNVVAQNANDLPFALSYLLNKYGNLYPIDLIGDFIRQQAKTQGLTIRQQLDSGIRYIDFRIIYSEDPVTKIQNWYSMHMVQTNQIAQVYLKEIREWLEEHKQEIVVMSFSRHGNLCRQGEDAYPNVSYDQKKQFWDQFLEMYNGILFNQTQNKMNETTIGELLDQGQRVIVYASDYQNFTNNSDLAQDGCLVINEGSISIDNLEQDEKGFLEQLKNMNQTLTETKKKNQFYLKSLAGGSPDAQLIYAFEIEILGNKTQAQEKCANLFHIPNSTFCPLNLQQASQLKNYYTQKAFQIAYQNKYRFPNAFYLDAVDFNGTFRTGTQNFPLPNYQSNYFNKNKIDTLTQKFAYAWTLIHSNAQVSCIQYPVASCTEVQILAQEKIKVQYPFVQWLENSYARLVDWPAL